MKKIMLIALAVLSTSALAQSEKPSGCSAIFLNNKMVVDEYSPSGKCKLLKTTIGELSAGTVSLDEKVEITSKFEFMIALKDGETGSLTMFSKESYQKIDTQKVMQKCRKGDKIVFITTDENLELLHNEILVE